MENVYRKKKIPITNINILVYFSTDHSSLSARKKASFMTKNVLVNINYESQIRENILGIYQNFLKTMSSEYFQYTIWWGNKAYEPSWRSLHPKVTSCVQSVFPLFFIPNIRIYDTQKKLGNFCQVLIFSSKVLQIQIPWKWTKIYRKKW